jgi:hypothetical protein
VTRTARLCGLLALPALVTGCGAAQQTAPATAQGAGGPPETAAMVCGDEIKGEVQQVLALPAQPRTRSTWQDGLFTCTYSLPAGPMTLSVRVLPDDASAGARLDADRARTPGAQPLAGLGERAWGSPDGTAAVLKDAQILTVDTTRLPETSGANGQRRTDLAYEVASDVLGCWTGNDS